jgi:hypothetical protein
VMDRALVVQGELAGRGFHRSVKIGDLLIAAAAEQASLVVLHYDRDFDRIADVTGQPTKWVIATGLGGGFGLIRGTTEPLGLT